MTLALVSRAWLSCLSLSDAAGADEPGRVRVGRQGGFVRVVIESASKGEFRSTLSSDGRSATIVLPGLRQLMPLPPVLAPLATMQATFDRAHRAMTVTLHFSRPVRLAETLNIPPASGRGHRLALDYAALATASPPLAVPAPPTNPPPLSSVAASPTVAAPAIAVGPTTPPPWADPGDAAAVPLSPAAVASVTPQAGAPPQTAPRDAATPQATTPPVAPPQAAAPQAAAAAADAADTADAPSLASVLGAIHFGSGEDQTVEAIPAQFGAQASPVRAAARNSATGERKLFVSFDAPIVILGAAHAIYQFDPQSQALIEAQFDWGDTFGGGLTVEQREALTRQMLAALAAAGFQPASFILGASAPSNGWLVYSGADGADRRTQIWAIPALPSGAAADDVARFVLRLVVAPSPAQRPPQPTPTLGKPAVAKRR